ncbi:MAG: PAS domain S-box protein [Deltaproteobacteria bacterium]|nr:PAS domain S-box protein [Deltaproteobacteria bacterium]
MKSDDRLSQIVQGMAIPAFVINKDHVITHWNRACETLMGISAKTMLGTQATWKAYYSKERPVLADLIVDGASERTVAAYYPGLYAKSHLVDGAYEAQDFFPHMGERGKWLFFTATPLRDRSGTLTGAVEFFQDITHQKEAEEELRQSEAFLNTLIDAIPIPVFYKDKAGRLLGVNQAFETFFSEARERLKGKTVFDIMPPESARILDAKDRVLMEHGGIQQYETQVTNQRGELRHIIINKSVFTDDQGGVNGLIGAILDITERKRAEEQRAQLETQLRQSQKMEAIGTLAGGIAHDFNNILMPLLLNAEMALEDLPEASPLKTNLQEVLKAGNRARDLVKQILAFSRQNQEQRSPLHVGPIVKEALKLLRSTLPSTIEIRQEMDITPGRDTIRADPTQIHQVLMNLCTNAFHAMQDQGGTLTVGLTHVPIGDDADPALRGLNPGTYVKLTVGDTGGGMSPDIRDRIFEPYYTTKGKGEGTGLGLSVVHGIVKSHKGAVRVESEPGKGTTFQVFFPLFHSEVTVKEDLTSKIPGGNERVLFVDDEAVSVGVVETLLERLGYAVDTQTSSVEALKMFQNDPQRFDLIITDQTMPGMTGADLAKEIMRIRPRVPIILCTGFSEQINEEQAKEMGIRAFIMKPFVSRQLAKTVRGVLDESG